MSVLWCIYRSIMCLYVASDTCDQERPYSNDSTASRLLSEVKHCLVQLGLRIHNHYEWNALLEGGEYKPLLLLVVDIALAAHDMQMYCRHLFSFGFTRYSKWRRNSNPAPHCRKGKHWQLIPMRPPQFLLRKFDVISSFANTSLQSSRYRSGEHSERKESSCNAYHL